MHWSGRQPEWSQVVVKPSGEVLAERNREDVQTADNPPPKRRRLWTKARVIDGQPQLCTDSAKRRRIVGYVAMSSLHASMRIGDGHMLLRDYAFNASG